MCSCNYPDVPASKSDKFQELLLNEELYIYWDYNDELSDEHIKMIIDGNLNEVENEICDLNIDYLSNLEIDLLKETLRNIDEDPDDYDLYMLRDNYELPSIDINLKSLINRERINVRVIAFSNYDCLNSHYLHNYGSFYTYNNVLKQIIDILYLNPALVKKSFRNAGWDVHGNWPNYKWRNGKEYVKYDDLVQELENNTSCSLLNFTAKLDLADLLDGKPKKIKIPKGNYCGLFSHFNGGGSILEMELQRDLIIDLTKPHGECKQYDTFDLVYDDENDYGYSMEEVYGLTPEFWRKPITILEYQKENSTQSIVAV